MKPRLLDLFCGAGGAAMGYYRAGFEVVGVDIKPQPHYPFDFHEADAIETLEEVAFTDKWNDFNAIHTSPPCQAYTRATNKHRIYDGFEYPDLIQDVRELLKQTKLPYVIENVVGSPLETCIILRGDMFDLRVIRPRLFELSFLVLQPQVRKQKGLLAGRDYFRVMSGGGCWCKGEETKGTFEQWKKAMGIDWADFYELTQAIPPAYTEYIGKYLMQAVLRDEPKQPEPKARIPSEE